MRIVKLNLYEFDSPFVIEFKNSHMSRSKAETIILEILCDNGIAGWGEGAPRSYVTGESIETVANFFEEIVSSILFQTDIEDVKSIEHVFDLIDHDCIGRKFFNCHSGLAALDIALLDALGKKNKADIVDMMGPPLRNSIPYSISAPLVPLEIIKQGFEVVKSLGLKHVKVLMNSDADENYERVRCIRSLFGEDAEVRIEANGAWTLESGLENVKKLKPLGIAAIEQPTAPHDLNVLREFRQKSGIPVVADESLCSLEDAKQLVAAQACDVFNIKLSKCGGFLRSRKIAAFAESQGVQCQLGSHVGETRILHRAGECFALTTPNVFFYEGCSPFLFGVDIKTAFNNREKEPAYGLGVRMDRKNLTPLVSIGCSD